MKMRMDNESLEMAVFTAEIMKGRLDDIATLNTDHEQLANLGNAIMREVATRTYHEQLDDLCAHLGELATNLPIAEILTESAELRSIAEKPVIDARSAAQNIRQYGGSLAVLLPFAADKITGKTDEITASLENTKVQELDAEAQERLEQLAAVESVYSAVASSAVADKILPHFRLPGSSEKSEGVPQHSSPLTREELVRQLTETEPRHRLLEYCTAFTCYPIEVTMLADIVYLHDSREQTKKRHVMTSTINPKQVAGRVTYRKLAERGLVLQHGWVMRASDNPEGTQQKKRVVRSITITNYSEESLVGNATDGTDHYDWEPIDKDNLNLAQR